MCITFKIRLKKSQIYVKNFVIFLITEKVQKYIIKYIIILNY